MAVSRLELYIDASSINTSLKIRDRDLVEKYLETQKFPIIYYKSKSVRQVKPNQFEVIGDFSLHGVTKELRITLTTIGDIINDEKARELGLKLQPLKINRRDYGIMEGAVGSATVGDTVTVSAVIRLRDVTPYRKDIDVRYPETPASARASLTTPFIGWYVSSRGARIDLISDGSNYFVSFSDDNWSWLAQAKMVGPNQFKLMSFSNLVELTSVGLTYTKPGAQPEPFTRVVKN